MIAKLKYLLIANLDQILVFLVGVVARCGWLTSIPIFNDEAIYLDWGWRASHLSGAAYLSLTDGKPPLLIWLFGLMQNIVANPLLAGRLVSVMAGGASSLGIYLLAKQYFSKKVGIVAALIYIVTPLFFLYDRQALMESMLAALAIWSIYFLLRLIKRHQAIDGYALGALLGAGYFVKSTMFVFVLATIVVLLVAYFKKKISNKQIRADLIDALLTSQVVLLPLYLQSEFWRTLATNDRYIMTLSQLIRFPFGQWLQNLIGLGEIGWWYLTPLLFLLALGGVYLAARGSFAKQMMALWMGSNLLIFVLVAQQVTVRYAMPFLPLGCIFAALFAQFIWHRQKILSLLLLSAGLLFAICLSLLQMIRPLDYFSLLSKITRYSQQGNYVNQWTAGFGVTQAKSFIESQVKDTPVSVAVRLDAGNPESGVLSLFHANSNVKLSYLDSSLFNFDINQFDCLSSKEPLYYISRDQQLGGLDKFLREVKRFNNPGNQSSVGVYMLNSPCQGKTLDISVGK